MKNFSLALILALTLFLSPTHANETVKITVNAGARHTFGGLGSSSVNRTHYQKLPEANRIKLAQMVWDTCDFRILRLWAFSDFKSASAAAQSFSDSYTEIVARAQDAQSDLTLLFAPCNYKSNWSYDEYTEFYTEQLRLVRETHGIHITVTGVMNEPNSHTDFFKPSDFNQLVKLFRQKLDAKGLNDVKVVGPEVSNVDATGWSYIDAIRNDADAVEDLHAFSSHSYNMSMTRSLATTLEQYGKKEFWQTEGSGSGPESFEDDTTAANVMARVLSELNLHVTHWLYFICYFQYDPNDNTTRIIGFDENTGEYREFLKYHYFKHFAKAFSKGMKMRLCESDLGSGDRDKYMEFQFGRKPPVYAAAGVNSDGTYAMGVTNLTGTPKDMWQEYVLAEYPSKATYNVTFSVEELAGSEDITFEVYRTNKLTQVKKESDVVMNGGQVTISVAPWEFVTLRSTKSPSVSIADPIKAKSATAKVTVRRKNKMVLFSGPGSVADIYSPNGTLLRRISLGLGATTAWNQKDETGKIVGPGMYFARIAHGNQAYSVKFLVR